MISRFGSRRVEFKNLLKFIKSNLNPCENTAVSFVMWGGNSCRGLLCICRQGVIRSLCPSKKEFERFKFGGNLFFMFF